MTIDKTHTIDGNMEENNNQSVPESISTDTGTTTSSISKSPLPREEIVATTKKLRTFSFATIKVSAEETNFVKGRQTSPTNLTKLESINNILTKDIGVDEVRQFIKQNRNRIGVSQKGSKKAICDAIADAWIRYDRDIKIDGKSPEEAGLVTVVDLTNNSNNASGKKTPKIDLFRFTNVLFGEKIRQSLMERGGNMNKEDLDEGKKKDQDLFEKLMAEYNDHNVIEYGESAFPRIWSSDALGFSEQFDRCLYWDQMKRPYHDLLNRYVDVQSRMQQSGTHDDGEEIPIEKFTPSLLLQYFHCHVQDNPGVFEKAHGDLPDEANFDSMKNTVVSVKREKKRAKTSNPMVEAIQEYSKAIAAGVETRQSELLTQQEQLTVTKQLNASTEKLNAIRTRRESEELLGQLEQHLDRKIPNTPERVERVRAHKLRVASRGGKTDEDSVEAYADLMDRIQYNKEYIKRLQEEEKESWKGKNCG